MLMMMISLGLTLLYSTLSIRIDQRSSRDSTQSVVRHSATIECRRRSINQEKTGRRERTLQTAKTPI
ncbi:hypothetical protein H4Q26_009075 [Puccinia striiformis f. sp. tritici PST-130]|nr:hypothetical protein Pst134EB_022160 [Puccinia striiformis f. sp. tritici]KAI9614684.1 hypothetical protein H4Q26_009075 [Puccinia striiformis f. sp. tritici PST-130]